MSAPHTLVDIAQRSGNEKVAAVVEDVTIFAPEWGLIPAITVSGTSYEVMRRIGLPHGFFRAVGGGVPMLKTEWAREVKPMSYFDNQLCIGHDIVLAQARGDNAKIPDVLSDEAASNISGNAIYFGTQAYYGLTLDPAGHMGLNAMVSDPRTQAQIDAGNVNNPFDINAGGVPGSTSSAYLAFLDDNPDNPEGLHYAVGLNGAMSFGEWKQVQSTIGKDALNRPLRRTDWTNGFEFYVGLNVGSKTAVFRIRNIDLAHQLTDALAAQLVSAIPVARRRNLRWFMNRSALYTLRLSRTQALYNQGQGGNLAPVPTELEGFPITVTDSLLNTETDGVATPPDFTDSIR